MNTSVSQPASMASSTAYWISGLSTTGSISLGTVLVAGRNRVPRPATGNTALRTCWNMLTPESKESVDAPRHRRRRGGGLVARVFGNQLAQQLLERGLVEALHGLAGAHQRGLDRGARQLARLRQHDLRMRR